jgi:hypothetical protein
VREEGAPKSQGVSVECVRDSAGALAKSRRVICSCVVSFCVVVVVVLWNGPCMLLL